MKLFFTLLIACAVELSIAQQQDGDTTPRDNCLEDNYRLVHRKPSALLKCKQEDMSVENVESEDAFTCKEGEMVKGLTVTASLIFNTARHDFGWVVPLDGGDGLNGNCSASTLLQEDMGDDVALHGDNVNATVAHLKWLPETNGKVDSCVDIVYETGGKASIDDVVLIDNLDVPCTDANDDYNMDINICFSWTYPGPNDKFCEVDKLHPGKPTRCLCLSVDIPTSTVEKEIDMEIDPNAFIVAGDA